MTYPQHAVFLDPDYRKTPDTFKPWCERCMKPIKDISRAIRVTVLDVHVWRDNKGDGWLGSDCAKKIELSKIEGQKP